jgi:hypothetical protein
LPRLSLSRGWNRAAATAVVALALVTAQLADAHGARTRVPSRCPSTGAMSRPSRTNMVNLQASTTRHSISCSYFNGGGNVFVNYVIENAFGESTSGFWAGMKNSARGAHAKLHKFKAGKAAAWYQDSRSSVYAEVLLGKHEISIEDHGQSGPTVIKIAQAFL